MSKILKFYFYFLPLQHIRERHQRPAARLAGLPGGEASREHPKPLPLLPSEPPPPQHELDRPQLALFRLQPAQPPAAASRRQ